MNIKRKILIFSHEFPPIVGGAGTYAFELAKGLQLLNQDVTVLCKKNSEKLDSKIDEELTDLGINIVRKIWVEKIWFFYWHIIFRVFLKKNKFDFIIIADYASNIVASKIKSKLLKNYCVTLHGTDLHYYFQQKRIKDKVMFSNKKMINYFNDSKSIICVSNYLKKQLDVYTEITNSRKVIHHGINRSDFKDLENMDKVLKKKEYLKKNNLNEKTFIILSAGRLVEDKGHDVLLESFSKVYSKYPYARLFVAGDGPLGAELKNKAQLLGVEESVEFLGNLSRKDLMKIYQISDLFTMISRREGETFGIVNIEAMACGLPVLGSNRGAISEIITNKNSLTTDPLSVDECADKMMFFMENDEKRKQMGIHSVEIVNEYFTNKVMAENHLKLMFE